MAVRPSHQCEYWAAHHAIFCTSTKKHQQTNIRKPAKAATACKATCTGGCGQHAHEEQQHNASCVQARHLCNTTTKNQQQLFDNPTKGNAKGRMKVYVWHMLQSQLRAQPFKSMLRDLQPVVRNGGMAQRLPRFHRKVPEYCSSEWLPMYLNVAGAIPFDEHIGGHQHVSDDIPFP